jgi:methionyl-tRNA synthetase
MASADKANRYIEDKKPWAMIKDEAQVDAVQLVCTQGLNLFRTLMIYLTPVIPAVASEVQELFQEGSWSWAQSSEALLGQEISRYKPLLTRVDASQVEKMVEQSRGSVGKTEAPADADTISIDDFMKIDLRVALITHAEAVEGADKLLRLTLDLGGETRNVFAGIKAAYKTEDLIGRRVVAVANLAPRKMRFGVSEGMVLASGPGGEDIFLLSVDDGASPGMRVK